MIRQEDEDMHIIEGARLHNINSIVEFNVTCTAEHHGLIHVIYRISLNNETESNGTYQIID